MPLEPVATLVQLDRLVERSLALLEGPHDLLELGQRGLEAHLFDITLIHCLASGPWAAPNQRLNGSLMPGTISSDSAAPSRSTSAAAKADSASRAWASRSARNCSMSASRSLASRSSVGATVPAAFWALATAASSSRWLVRPRVTGSFGWMLAMF